VHLQSPSFIHMGNCISISLVGWSCRCSRVHQSCLRYHFMVGRLPIDSPWSSRSNASNRIAREAPERRRRRQLARRRWVNRLSQPCWLVLPTWQLIRLWPHESVSVARVRFSKKSFPLLCNSRKCWKPRKFISISFLIRKMQIIYQIDHKKKTYLFVP
jgi:hypothetical protein